MLGASCLKQSRSYNVCVELAPRGVLPRAAICHGLELQQPQIRNGAPVYEIGMVDARLRAMEKDLIVAEMLKQSRMGRGARAAIIAAVMVLFAILVGAVATGFRSRHISQNAAAMTTPIATHSKARWHPWWLR